MDAVWMHQLAESLPSFMRLQHVRVRLYVEDLMRSFAFDQAAAEEFNEQSERIRRLSIPSRLNLLFVPVLAEWRLGGLGTFSQHFGGSERAKIAIDTNSFFAVPL